LQQATGIRAREKIGAFTLTEVMCAIFVFLVGIVGVISLFAAAGVFHKIARDRAMTSLVVQEVVSGIDQRLSEGGLRDDNGELEQVVQEPVPGFERYSYDVVFNEEGATGRSLITARIAVTWREKGKLKEEKFDYVFRSGPGLSRIVGEFKEKKNNSGGGTGALPPDDE